MAPDVKENLRTRRRRVDSMGKGSMYLVREGAVERRIGA